MPAPVAQQRAKTAVMEQPGFQARRGPGETGGGQNQERRRRQHRQHSPDKADGDEADAEGGPQKALQAPAFQSGSPLSWRPFARPYCAAACFLATNGHSPDATGRPPCWKDALKVSRCPRKLSECDKKAGAAVAPAFHHIRSGPDYPARTLAGAGMWRVATRTSTAVASTSAAAMPSTA